MKDVYDPMPGDKAQRIIHTNTSSIVVKKSELSSIVHSYYDQSKGGQIDMVDRVRNRLSLGERKVFEVSKEDQTEFELKSPSPKDNGKKREATLEKPLNIKECLAKNGKTGT